MTRLLSSPFAHDIGMSLLHSLWQIALVAVAFAIANRLLARRSANLRYAAAYAALVLMLALPAATLCVIAAMPASPHDSAVEVARELKISYAADSTLEAIAAYPTADAAPPPIESTEAWRIAAPLLPEAIASAAGPTSERGLNAILPWLSIGWSLGVVAFSLRPFLALHRCHQLRRRATAVEASWINDAVASLCAQVGLQRKVAIASSTLAQVPTVMGFMRPIIVLPLSMVTGQTAHELSAIIAHELGHIRRHDFLFNLVQTAIETLLFYHPAVWWLSSVVRQERENCCDDIAMSICGRKNYATALANLEFARTAGTGLALAADGGSLYRRIHRIARPYENPNPLGRWLAALVALLALLAGIVAVLPTDAAAVAAGAQQAGSAGESNDGVDGASTESEDDETSPAGLTRAHAGRAMDVDGHPDAQSEPTRIRGRVVDVEGNGVAAKVFVVDKRTGHVTKPGSEQILRSFESDPDGRFDCSMKLPSRDHAIDRGVWNANVLQLVATAPGYGPAASDIIDARQGKPVELRLAADDVPIDGAIRTLEGEPVIGATVRVAILECASDVGERIEALRRRMEREKPGRMQLSSLRVDDFLQPGFDTSANERIVARQLHHSQFTSQPVATDADGRFRLTGIGRGRLLALELSGPGIVTTWISVISQDIEPINAALFIGGRTRMTYGARFTYSAEPSQPIVGTITDVATGEPIEGVRVESSGGTSSAHAVSVTDSNGAYRLLGVPKSKAYRLNVIPPQEAPYFPQQNVEVTDVGVGLEPTSAEFKLRRTKWYSGRIVNKATGEPVRARIVYSPRIDNELAENYPAFVKGRSRTDAFHADDSVATNQDGKFRIRVIPGNGMLFVRCSEPSFCTGFGRESLDATSNWWGERRTGQSQRMTNTYEPMFPEWVHRIWPLQIGDAPDEQLHEIDVDPGQTFDVRMVDSAGTPLSDVTVVGRVSRAFRLNERPTAADRIEIPAITPDNPRDVFFYHAGRNLGAFLVVPDPRDATLKESRELKRELRTVRLEPCATVKGRLLDRNGKPLADVPVGVNPLEIGDATRRYVIAWTDKEGRFQARRVIPETPLIFYEMSSSDGASISGSTKLKPGEVRDLGDVVPTKAEPDDQAGRTPDAAIVAPAPVALASASPNSGKVTRLTGRVLAAEADRPLASARLWKGRVRMDTEESILAEAGPDVLTANGEFKVPMSYFASTSPESLPADQWIDVALFATAEGHGFAWFTREDFAQTPTAELELVPDDVPIRGRVVDTEGRPVAGLEVSVKSVYASPSGSITAFLNALRDEPGPLMKHIRERLPRSSRLVHYEELGNQLGRPTANTNSDGRFEIAGVGRERLAAVVISGASYQTETFFIATRDMTSRGVSAGARSEVIHGANCTIVVTQGLTIQGVVTDKDTQRPLPGVLIRDSTLNNVSGAYRPVFSAKTDANGRYRITGFPRTGVNRLMAVPAEDQPYFLHDRIVATSTEPGGGAVDLNFALKRGIWITGSVTEKDSGMPVTAQLHYLPFLTNALAQELPEIVAGSLQLDSSRLQSRYRSNPDGAYRLVGLPGRAIVAVGNATGQQYLTATGADRIDGLNDEGEYPTFANPTNAGLGALALAEINPTDSQREVRVDFQLQHGSQRTLQIVDPDGKPVTNASVSGLSPTANYSPQEHVSPMMTVVALAPAEERTILIQHRRRGLAARTEIDADRGEMEVVKLREAATISGRLVDVNGAVVRTRIEATTTLIRNQVRLSESPTDEAGAFLLTGLPDGVSLQLRLQGSSYRLPAPVREITTAAGKTIDLGTLVVR